MVNANVDNRVIFVELNTNESITIPSNETWKIRINGGIVLVAGSNRVPTNTNIFVPGGSLIDNLSSNDKAFVNGIVIKD